MKNPITELAFLVLIAWLLSSLLYGVIAFTLANMDMFNETAKVSLNSVSSAFAGLIVGYKLRDIVLGNPKTAKKKKK